ncbi:MAG: hypothetical protein ACOCXT_06155 [Candidatus Dojkabacteria bacterium]
MKAEDPSIHIAIVGFPSSGNNQNLAQDTTSKEAQWIKALQGVINEKCSGVNCFDSVSDHLYPFAVHLAGGGGYTGISAYTSSNMYEKIFDRLKKQYNKPIAITEWNIMCWKADSGGWQNSFDHGFNTYNMIMSMVRANALAGSYHSLLADNHACAIFEKNKEPNIHGKIFEHTSALQGAKYYDVSIPASPIFTAPDSPACNDIKCLKGGEKVDMIKGVGALATNGDTYVYLSNSSLSEQKVSLNFTDKGKLSAYRSAKVKVLAASPDYEFGEFATTTSVLDSRKVESSSYTVPLSQGMGLSLPPGSFTRVQLTTAGPECVDLSFENSSKNYTLRPGENVNLVGTVDNPINNSAGIAFYNLNNKDTNGIPRGAKLSPVKTVSGATPLTAEGTGLSQVTGDDNGTPRRVFKFTVSYDQLFNGIVDKSNNNAPVESLQLNAFLGGMTRSQEKCVVYVTKDEVEPTDDPYEQSSATSSPTKPSPSATSPPASTATNLPLAQTSLTPSQNPSSTNPPAADNYTVTLTPTPYSTQLPKSGIPSIAYIPIIVGGGFVAVSFMVVRRRRVFESSVIDSVDNEEVW